MIALATMYLHGVGMLPDRVRAYMWYNILNTMPDGLGEWRDALQALTDSMTVAQVNQSQAMALECQQSHFQNCGD